MEILNFNTPLVFKRFVPSSGKIFSGNKRVSFKSSLVQVSNTQAEIKLNRSIETPPDKQRFWVNNNEPRKNDAALLPITFKRFVPAASRLAVRNWVASDSKPSAGNRSVSGSKIPVRNKSVSGSKIPVRNESVSGSKIPVRNKSVSGSKIPVRNKSVSGSKMPVRNKSVSGSKIPVRNKSISDSRIPVRNSLPFNSTTTGKSPGISGSKIPVRSEPLCGGKVSGSNTQAKPANPKSSVLKSILKKTPAHYSSQLSKPDKKSVSFSKDILVKNA